MPQSSLLKWLSTDKESTKIEKSAPASQESHETHEESGVSSPPKPVDHEKEAIHEQETKTAKSNPNKPSRPLPSNIELRACSKDDIPALKRITSLLLPIPYPEKFFREILDDPVTNDLTLVAIWHEKRSSDPHEPSTSNNPSGDGGGGGGKATLIGAIRCRLLSSLPGTAGSNILGDEAPMLYLSTLVLLSPYRSLGVASHMLRILVRRAIEDYGVSRVGAHVWSANTEGLEWYQRRGFEEISREEDYYRRLSPSSAVVMQRSFEAGDCD